MPQLYVLFEHAAGYGLFRVKEFEEVGAFLPQVEASVLDASKFQQVVQLVGFKPFISAASALENMNAVTEGIVTNDLQAFLNTNVPQTGKKKDIQLGVVDSKLATSIAEATGFSVTHVGVVPEIVRGIRLHLTQFVKGLTSKSMKQTELGLGHSYSRGKVKFNVHRADNMIIQSIALIDQLDKDINTFAMRIREWYSYHFPELVKIVPDNYHYAMSANFIKNRNSLTEESLPKLEEITMDSAKAQAILDAARMSMGMDISIIDLLNIERFAKRVIGLAEYRKKLAEYLKERMNNVAPNLATLIGEVVGARLISHAGSLTNLAKYPASTVQILGAEKALFRALKTRGNTPKYGLIFHSTFISRAAAKNKGRISRYLANKCSIASRIDCFTENPTAIYGEKLREQVEDRLKFYETGDIPRKNVEVMSEAVKAHMEEVAKEEKRSKKRKASETDIVGVNGDTVTNGEDSEEPPKKKKKKKKKASEEEEAEPEPEPMAVEVPEPVEEAPAEEPEQDVQESGEKKKKKKKKKGGMEDAGSPVVNGGEEEAMVVAEPEPEPEAAVAEVPEGGKKKKKKKKKGGVEDEAPAGVNGDQVEVEAVPEPEPEASAAAAEEPEGGKKKKKKKKKGGAEEEALSGVNGDAVEAEPVPEPEPEAEAAPTEENPESAKKKKKKKKKQPVEEAE
ncbi:nop56 ribonucleoprotein [Oratosquilla oratoria]|uniref:nop56 ribonucleoprotein n=1 Tax=Oratosquilla oratoria TaxID=337810 RepID=UPI003F7694DF